MFEILFEFFGGILLELIIINKPGVHPLIFIFSTVIRLAFIGLGIMIILPVFTLPNADLTFKVFMVILGLVIAGAFIIFQVISTQNWLKGRKQK